MLDEAARRAFFRRVLQHRPKTIDGAHSAVIASLADGALLLTFRGNKLLVEFRLRANHSTEAGTLYEQLHANRDAIDRKSSVALQWHTVRKSVEAVYPGSMSWATRTSRKAQPHRSDTTQGMEWTRRSLARADAVSWASMAKDELMGFVVREFRSDLSAPTNPESGLFAGRSARAQSSTRDQVLAKSVTHTPKPSTPVTQRTQDLPDSALISSQKSNPHGTHYGQSKSYAQRVRALELVQTGESRQRGKSTLSRPQRSQEARSLVIERSSGHCENPECGNPSFSEWTPAGEPLLEVDHVQDLALDGADHPANMIALCPNCHAVKTRGARGEQVRKIFAAAARRRHAAAMTRDRAT